MNEDEKKEEVVIQDEEVKTSDEVTEEIKVENMVEEVAEQPVVETVEEMTAKTEKNKKGKKCIIIAILIIAVLAGLYLGYYFGLLKINNKIGNSIGNIRNYGYAAEEGNQIYYISPSEDGEKISIYKCKKNGKDIKTLLTESWEIYGLNASGDYLYFIGINMSDSKYQEDDYVDNKIYRMRTNGKDLEVINDNEFNNDSYEIYLIEDRIYYMGEDYNVYSMDLNGENKKVINDDATGFIGINDKYIILNKEDETDKIVTYSMNLDGSDKKVITGERLYSVNILEDDVYYVDTNKHVYKANIKTGENTLISETSAYNMNVTNEAIYFMNYTDDTGNYIGIYKMNLDGTEEKLILQLESYSNFLDVIDDKILYMDSTLEEGLVYLLDVNSSEVINLYTYEFYPEGNEPVSDTTSDTAADTTADTTK